MIGFTANQGTRKGIRRRPAPRDRRGFVLLVTLLLLALVALAMVASARASCAAALAADADARQVQARWAACSCQYTLLADGERLLAGREARDHRPVTSLRAGLSLGCTRLDLTLSDEQAKVSVPTMLARRGGDRNQVEVDIRRLVSPVGAAGLLRLRQASTNVAPDAVRVGGDDALAPGLGEVFDVARPDALKAIVPDGGNGGAAALVTCWGGGRLNWRRADDAALRLVLCPPLTYSQVGRLQAARSAHLGLGQALDGLGLDGGQRAAVEATLADGSTCHGLWVVARAADRHGVSIGPPILRRQAILDRSGSTSGVLCFDW